MLEYIIIGFLLDDSLTGYDIKKNIETRTGLFYKASYSSIYPTLKRLTEKGYLLVSEQTQGNREKKYYRATEQGKLYFYEWLSSPIDFNDEKNNHLLKVYFFDRLPDADRNRLLREYELHNMNYLLRLQSLEKHFSRLKRDDDYFRLSTLYYGIRITEENIRWCRHLVERKPLSLLLEDSIN